MSSKLTDVKRQSNGLYSCHEGYLIKIKNCSEYSNGEEIEIRYTFNNMDNKVVFAKSKKEYGVEMIYKKSK